MQAKCAVLIESTTFINRSLLRREQSHFHQIALFDRLMNWIEGNQIDSKANHIDLITIAIESWFELNKRTTPLYGQTSPAPT